MLRLRMAWVRAVGCVANSRTVVKSRTGTGFGEVYSVIVIVGAVNASVASRIYACIALGVEVLGLFIVHVICRSISMLI